MPERTFRLGLGVAELEEARAKRPALRDTRPEVLRRLWRAGGGE